ncbi:methylmalonyl-CoA epimerase [bacterium]|nr:methylmalonyl-CoA epimerase [bacterium]
MQIKKIEHIGIAVKSIAEALKFYEGVLGFNCYNIETVEDQKVKTAFLKVGEIKLELLESTAPDGPIAKFIEKRGEGIHHIAYNVAHVNEALHEAAQKHIVLIDEQSRAGAEGFQIGFLHPKSTFGVLTEFCGTND